MANTSACNKSFSSNYIVLKPEKASLLDICKILFFSDIAKRNFVDCPADGISSPFGRRWIIFLSILVQKLLLAMAKPMAAFGAGVEFWLNLVSINGGLFRLLMNRFKGKVIYPDKKSESFLSLIGYSDKRTDLLNMINSHGHVDNIRYYYALLSLMAAKASYENKKYVETVVNDHWKMDFLGSYDFWNDYQEKATTQAFVLEDKKDLIVVAFRGTEPFDADAWTSDFDISWYELPGVGKIHGGFMKALGMQKNLGWPKQEPDNKPEAAYYALRKLLKERLQNNDKAKFIVTGHSLGAALALLFPLILAIHEESGLLDRLEGIYTFGQPRVGDGEFVKYLENVIEKHDIDYYRFVYSFDIVPRLPYDNSTLMFKHFGTCIFYNNFYEGKVVAEEPDKNYFSVIWLIPKLLNAWWELIRSFIISYTRGPVYKEGGVMRMLRVNGLLIPGISAHCFQDYSNGIRLGSSHIFSSISNSNTKKPASKIE